MRGRSAFRVLYFSPVEFSCCLVVPSSMSYETESEFQIATRTRGAGSVAFRHAPQPRPRLPIAKNLIASLELGFSVSPIRITKLQFSNRKYFAILPLLLCATNPESQPTEVLIQNARLEFDLSGKDSNRLQISNRERMGFSVSLPPRAANSPNLEPQPARRIRDTSPDNASPRAFPRCYASCGSRRKSE